MLLSMAERRLGIAQRLAHWFPDRRDPLRITHTLADMVRARILAIACGYEDADLILTALRVDPAFKLACGRLHPTTGANLCSQPTLSRLENAPSALKDAIRLTWALGIDQWMASYDRQPASVTLDIDDTCDVLVRGHQQLSLFNAHYDEGAAFCRSMSTTPSARVPSRSCCAPARPRPRTDRRCALICAGSCAISVNAGRGRASHSEATATTPDPRRWNGARPTESITSSACPVRSRWRRKSTRRRKAVRTERAVSNKPVVRGYAETRHKANPGTASGAPSPASKPPRSGSTPASSSPTSNTARRNGFTTPSIARAGRPRTSSSCTRRSSRPIEPPAVPPSATRSASFCTQRPIGSCSTVRDAIPQTARSRQRRVLDLAAAADQDRSPRHRNRKPRPSRFFAAGCPEADLFRSLPGQPSQPSAPERPGKKAPPPPVIPPTRS